MACANFCSAADLGTIRGTALTLADPNERADAARDMKAERVSQALRETVMIETPPPLAEVQAQLGPADPLTAGIFALGIVVSLVEAFTAGKAVEQALDA